MDHEFLMAMQNGLLAFLFLRITPELSSYGGNPEVTRAFSVRGKSPPSHIEQEISENMIAAMKEQWLEKAKAPLGL